MTGYDLRPARRDCTMTRQDPRSFTRETARNRTAIPRFGHPFFRSSTVFNDPTLRTHSRQIISLFYSKSFPFASWYVKLEFPYLSDWKTDPERAQKGPQSQPKPHQPRPGRGEAARRGQPSMAGRPPHSTGRLPCPTGRLPSHGRPAPWFPPPTSKIFDTPSSLAYINPPFFPKKRSENF